MSDPTNDAGRSDAEGIENDEETDTDDAADADEYGEQEYSDRERFEDDERSARSGVDPATRAIIDDGGLTEGL